MKKTISVFLCVLLIGALFACTSQQSKLSENTNTVQYVIYCSSMDFVDSINSERESATNAEKMPNDIQFKECSEIVLSMVKRAEVSNSAAATQKTITINGTNYSLPLSTSYATALADCDNADLKVYGLVDQYWSSDGIVAEYRQGSGELLFYSELGATSSDGQLTTDEATKIAAELLESLYGADVAGRYTHDRTSKEDEFVYVNYTRYIQGYATDDAIQIKLKSNGEIKSINAMKIGIFDHLEDKITVKKIQAAESTLCTSISYMWDLDEGTKKLVIGSDGKCYIEILGVNNSASDESPENTIVKFYINVE